MLKKMRGSAMTVTLFLTLGFLSSCSKESVATKTVVPLSQVDETFIQGQFSGKFGGQPVTFTFNNGTVDLVVSLGKALGGNLIIQGGHYEIIKQGVDTKLLELRGDVDAHLVWLVASVTPAGSSEIGNAGTTAGNGTDFGQDFTAKHPYDPTNDPVVAALGSGSTDWVAFPIFIEGAFLKGGKKGLSIKFAPSSAYFGSSEATAKADLEKDLNIASGVFTGPLKTLSSEASEYLQK